MQAGHESDAECNKSCLENTADPRVADAARCYGGTPSRTPRILTRLVSTPKKEASSDMKPSSNCSRSSWSTTILKFCRRVIVAFTGDLSSEMLGEAGTGER